MEMKYPIIDISPKRDLIIAHKDDRFLIRADEKSIKEELFKGLVFVDSEGKEFTSLGVSQKGWSGFFGIDKYSFQSLKRHKKIEILFQSTSNKAYNLTELKEAIKYKLQNTPKNKINMYESIKYLASRVEACNSIPELIQCFI